MFYLRRLQRERRGGCLKSLFIFHGFWLSVHKKFVEMWKKKNSKQKAEGRKKQALQGPKGFFLQFRM